MAYLVDLQPSDQFEPGGLTPEERNGLSVLAKIVLGAVPISLIKLGLTREDASLVDRIRGLDLTKDDIANLEEVATQDAIDDKAIWDLFNKRKKL